MADNTTHDGYGNYRDCGGVDYRTPDSKPIEYAGTPVTIPNGTPTPGSGVWIGGYVYPDKKD